MKQIYTLAALAATTLITSATTTFSNSGVTTTNRGSYFGASANLSDANWNVAGDAVGASVELTGVTFYRGSAAGGSGTDAASFLNVYSGGSFIGSSTNSINIESLPLIGDAAAFTFANLTIQSGTTYQYRFSATNTAGGTAHDARTQVVQPENLANGFMLDSGYTGQDTSWDAKYSISVVPEPSSAALLGLGGLALILRRRK